MGFGWTFNVSSSLLFILINSTNLQQQGRVAEWSALQTGKRGDSSSIPDEVKTYFGGSVSF